MKYVTKFNKSIINYDLYEMKRMIEYTNSILLKEVMKVSMINLLEFTHQEKKSEIYKDKFNINPSICDKILDTIKDDLPPNTIPNNLNNTVLENYIDFITEVNKESSNNKYSNIFFILKKRQMFNIFYEFQKKIFPEDNKTIRDIILNGRIEIKQIEENNLGYSGITSNFPNLNKQYISILYRDEITSRILEIMAHEFGHVSHLYRMNTNKSNEYKGFDILAEVPSYYHEFKFFDYFYTKQEENDAKYLAEYDDIFYLAKNNEDDIIQYIYALIICDIFNKLEKEDPKKFKNNLIYMKNNIGFIDSYEILDRFGIKETNINNMNETKDRYLKLARKYK